jgi:hypothetical protein
MKNQIILWLTSFVILFLIGYIKNITDEDYPITSTFGIEGHKVSYKLDKVSNSKSTYKNIIISDIKGVRGKLIWLLNDVKHEKEMIEIDRGLIVEIPVLKASQKISYKVVLSYKNKIYELPHDKFVTLTFWGNVPTAVEALYFILLYSGLLMTLRGALELFNQNKKLKNYIIITSSLFIALTIIINPLYSSYKLGAINHFVPHVTELLQPTMLILSIVWITGAVLIFYRRFIRTITVTMTVITIMIFFLL